MEVMSSRFVADMEGREELLEERGAVVSEEPTENTDSDPQEGETR